MLFTNKSNPGQGYLNDTSPLWVMNITSQILKPVIIELNLALLIFYACAFAIHNDSTKPDMLLCTHVFDIQLCENGWQNPGSCIFFLLSIEFNSLPRKSSTFAGGLIHYSTLVKPP
jgi:hypothetical protein